MDIYYFAPDGAVGTNWWVGGANNNQWQQPFNIAPAGSSRGDSGLSVLSLNSDHLHVFWIGTNAALMGNWWGS